jgi:hypothetical protein
MLFMVIEHFRDNDMLPVCRRLRCAQTREVVAPYLDR